MVAWRRSRCGGGGEAADGGGRTMGKKLKYGKPEKLKGPSAED
jgi:hypothetical protein